MVIAGMHKRTHTVVVVDPLGRQLGWKPTSSTTTTDHLGLVRWAERFGRDRVWAVEDRRHGLARLPRRRSSVRSPTSVGSAPKTPSPDTTAPPRCRYGPATGNGTGCPEPVIGSSTRPPPHRRHPDPPAPRRRRLPHSPPRHRRHHRRGPPSAQTPPLRRRLPGPPRRRKSASTRPERPPRPRPLDTGARGSAAAGSETYPANRIESRLLRTNLPAGVSDARLAPST
jgi:hypothetical protein